jgi:hypothetical protein
MTDAGITYPLLFVLERSMMNIIFIRSHIMSKLNDFYRRADTDSVLKAELVAVTTAYVAGVIGVAGKHGVSLAAADFAPASGELDDDALAEAAGGAQRIPYLPPGMSPGTPRF